MKLERVVVVNPVHVNGENKESLYEGNGALNLRWESGLVWFEDAKGSHFVPASNVRAATVAAKDAKK